MTKEEIIDLISQKIKLIRTEKGYTQDRMAEVLGLSKKTLVQIEKGRMTAGWSTAVTACALFRDSEILQASLGEDPLEIIETIAHDGLERPKEKTMGGKVWWRETQTQGRYRLQQNILSNHYRIIDDQDYRWFSTFEKSDALERLQELAKMKM
ncbi:helix-turn-helix domain-containing protein [Bacillus timonensis]|nr:helix-turn-helix domain-containing protein [Bacillus timonensis]